MKNKLDFYGKKGLYYAICKLIFYAIFYFLLMYITMTLWNLLMPGIFNVPRINIWQTMGLQFIFYNLFPCNHKFKNNSDNF